MEGEAVSQPMYPGRADLEIRIETTAQRRSLLVFLAETKAMELRAAGWSSDAVAFRVVGIACQSYMSRTIPVTSGGLRSMRPTVRACLKAAKCTGWELDSLEKDPKDCTRILCRLKRTTKRKGDDDG